MGSSLSEEEIQTSQDPKELLDPMGEVISNPKIMFFFTLCS